MLFNSFEFAIFLPLVFFSYWFVFNRNLRSQNFLILLCSYIFYGWWDWRFLSLILLSSLIDFTIGIFLKIYQVDKIRKIIITISVVINLGLLGFFKYFNFFIDSFSDLMLALGLHVSEISLKIILPVGISFYTFQSLSYTIDVYRKKLEPVKDIIAFLSFVSFFPQLVAGPIERAKSLLPQFAVERKFSYDNAVDGLRQTLWGLFKKVVVADNLSIQVDFIFNNFNSLPALSLWLGVIYFAFQIYCDFSGYSDMAIGIAKLFGFSLMRNFNYPYFSRDIAEFWRRWHISLSTWFRDYLYIPIGGSKGNKQKTIRNIIVVFTISGFWHGANWTFIAWGFLNGLFFLPLILTNSYRKNMNIVAEGRFVPKLRDLINIFSTFILTIIAWIFFRSENIGDAFGYLFSMFNKSIFYTPQKANVITNLFFIVILVVIEWIQRTKQHGLDLVQIKYPFLRWFIYLSFIFIIFVYGATEKTFIYFQF